MTQVIIYAYGSKISRMYQTTKSVLQVCVLGEVNSQSIFMIFYFREDIGIPTWNLTEYHLEFREVSNTLYLVHMHTGATGVLTPSAI